MGGRRERREEWRAKVRCVEGFAQLGGVAAKRVQREQRWGADQRVGAGGGACRREGCMGVEGNREEREREMLERRKIATEE